MRRKQVITKAVADTTTGILESVINLSEQLLAAPFDDVLARADVKRIDGRDRRQPRRATGRGPSGHSSGENEDEEPSGRDPKPATGSFVDRNNRVIDGCVVMRALRFVRVVKPSRTGCALEEDWMLSRRVYVGLLGLAAVPLAVVSLAWACAPQGVVTVDPISARSAGAVSVMVSGFPGGVPVDVRWNGASGPVLASGVGPSFTKAITVPQVDAGVYLITAATTDEHAQHTMAVATFEVMAPDPGSPPTGPVSPPAGGPVSAPEDPLSPTAIVVPMNPFAPAPAAGGKVITGTDGPDRLVGTPGRDVIRCKGGNDVVLAMGGDDIIDCGAGADRVDGGAGNDEIRGGPGNDTLTGGAGGDDIFGAAGNDKLAGGSGADRLYGGIGLDTLRGNGGRDRLTGDAGRDLLYADSADQVLRGRGDQILR